MLRTTISKLRQVCALTFVPRLLRGDLRGITPDRFERLSVCVQRRVDKSTSSVNQDQEDCERCQRIIDRAFAPPEPIDMSPRPKESFLNMVTPELPTPPEKQCEKCQRIINEIFGEENAGDGKRDTVDPVCIPLTELQATTAKENEETLAQKIERIDETPLVEAAPRAKPEGFNTQPKVLGFRKKRRVGERVPLLHYTSDKPAHGRRKGASRKDGSFDELAKRCLDSPSSNIDERLLKEMEKLGVPPTSRRGSRRTVHDAGIVQPEIMKRPRRPVAKTELDYLVMRRGRLQRLSSELPPPFELSPIRSHSINLVSCTDTNEGLRYERIPPFKDQILADVVAMSDDARTESMDLVMDCETTLAEDRPPHQLLGQMTATVMGDDSKVTPDRGSEVEQLFDNQEQRHRSLHHEETIYQQSGVVYGDREENKISLSKLKELENEHEKAVAREKLASAQVLSKLVDPKEISPQGHTPGMLQEEIEMLKHLLRTRVEYLTQEKVKRLHPKYSDTETAPVVDKVLMKEFTETEVESTLQELGVDKLNVENTPIHHHKEDINIMPNISAPTPSILIKKYIDTETKTELEPDMFKSYSKSRPLVTPHQYFEELAIISRETEVGAIMEELSESDKQTEKLESSKVTPKGPAAGQLIENVGVVSKDKTSYGPVVTKGPHITLSKKTDSQRPIDTHGKREEYGDNEYDSLCTLDITHRLGGNHEPKLEQEDHIVFTTSEKPIEIQEEPVIASEMSRLPRTDTMEYIPDHRIVTASQAMPETTQETVLHPLLDRGTVAHIGEQKLNPNMASGTTAIPEDVHSVNMPKRGVDNKNVPLSEMLKRVRERNRMEFCKQFEVRMAGPEVEPLVGGCGKKQPPCPPPAPKCPPSKCPPPPPPKPPCPNPCKPKCPPTCPPSTCPPSTCPPPKKSPCEKFQTAKCSNIQVQDVLTLLLYLGPQLHVPQKCLLPFLMSTITNVHSSETFDSCERIFTGLHKLCALVFVASLRNEVNALGAAVVGLDSKDYARTYDPWLPIPSWPIPVREDKRKLVCPKDGCKVAPPKLNPPCRDINPCLNFPKKHFSIIDYLTIALGHKVVYDIGNF